MHQENTELEKSGFKICKVLKLSNMDTIIGDVIKETQSYIDVMLPLKLLMVYHADGKITLSVVKWDLTMDYKHPIRVYKTSLVACGEPTEEMVSNYRESLNSMMSKEEDVLEENYEDEITELDEMMKKILKSTGNSGGNFH